MIKRKKDTRINPKTGKKEYRYEGDTNWVCKMEDY